MIRGSAQAKKGSSITSRLEPNWLQNLRQFRATEFRLLFLALLFFAAGYLLVVLAMDDELQATPTWQEMLNILWPSTLPLLLFLGISLGLSWRKSNADQMLLPLVALLTGLGLMLVARLRPPLVSMYGDIFAGVDTKQTLWVTLGAVILAIMIFVPWDRLFIRFQRSSLMDWLDHHRYTWLTVGLLLTLATFFFGVDPNNSGVRVWFNFGLFLFQPSELLKIILVIFLASYLEEHREVVSGGYSLGPITLPPLPYLIPLVGMWGIAMATIVFQRDLGAALLLFGVFLAMLYVATGNGWYVVSGLVAFAVGAIALYYVVPVVKLRVGVWLDPWATAQGTGYQIVQAAYALASGGIFGVGLGGGIPYIVPAIHTDFAFTAIGEELGLAGTLAVLVAYLLLIFRGYHIALAVPGRFRGFEQLLAIGLTTILAVQTFVIIGGNLRLIPLTGITLPFISYGGSSIIINFLIIGLLMRISASAGQQQSRP
jgi:cell division protein FtsW (lipid II flippase)